MNIVYLAWGSLKWNPDNLLIHNVNSWIYSNLKLPLEFSRISDNGKGRLTLVIDEINGTYNNVWYSYSTTKNVNIAINSLKKRENTSLNNIAYINLKNNKKRIINTPKNIQIIIYKWMIKNNIDVCIWTDLKSNWVNIKNEKYNIENAYNYFKNSSLDTRIKQLEYIYKAKEITKINTKFSSFFFKKLDDIKNK